MNATQKTIRDFLRLPKTAMPGASFVSDFESGNPWNTLRAYRDDPAIGCGEQVRLQADRPEWRDGVVVTLD